MNPIRSYPIIGAVIAQIGAGVIVMSLRPALVDVSDARVMLWAGLAAQGLMAAALTWLMRLPVWWIWIGLVFPASVGLALNAGALPAWPFGIAFVLLFLVFSNTARERVPLYLTNRQTAAALVSLMRQRGGRRVTDLGSGLGGVVRALAADGQLARGVESAPLVWLVSAALCGIKGRGQILRQDIWAANISREDLVYAFLSPEPMPALHEKARREMKRGSLLVSNSFPVPGVAPDEVWELPDRRATRLYLYEMSGPARAC